MIAPVARGRPFIDVAGNPSQFRYHSVDATYEALFTGLQRPAHRNAFLHISRDWLIGVIEQSMGNVSKME
jgi:hypothetical protein